MSKTVLAKKMEETMLYISIHNKPWQNIIYKEIVDEYSRKFKCASQDEVYENLDVFLFK